MIGMRIYRDLETEISILHDRIEDLRNEYEWWYKQINHGDRKPAAGMDKCIMRMNKITEDLKEYEYLYRNKVALKQRIESQLAQLEGIDKEVMYLSVVEGMTLSMISEELGYSESWIKRVHSRNSKKLSRLA